MSRSEHEMRQLDQEYGRVEDRRQKRLAKAAHTPGPWYITEIGTIEAYSHNPATIATISPFDHEANARLIAAAPEMLEALEYINRFYMSNSHKREAKELPNPDCPHCKAEAAIQKARGQQ